jgi:hypothetical protein
MWAERLFEGGFWIWFFLVQEKEREREERKRREGFFSRDFGDVWEIEIMHQKDS